MYMDDIKLFAKSERKLEVLIKTLRIYSEDIGMEFGLEKSAMLVTKSRKGLMKEVIELSHQENTTIGEKEN